jgi:hypothetical protein
VTNDDDNDDTAIERYEAKVEAKRERYAERAGKARSEANGRARAAHVILDGIPMGQPILVGHHSERRHRRDLERADTNIRKSIEAEGKAAHYAHKAETYGTHGISSDDPAAVRKLRDELVERQATRGAEKLWNRALKVGATKRERELGRPLTRDDHVALIEALAMPEPLKKQMLSYARAFPWLPKFGNHTQADINRIEKRIAELERARQMPEREPLRGTVDGVSYTVEWNKADNRVQIYFPTRPSDAVVERLKSRGFRWARSVAAWQRQANEGAWYHARWIVGHKEPTVEVTPGEEHTPGCAMSHCPHYECGPASAFCPPCEEQDNG